MMGVMQTLCSAVLLMMAWMFLDLTDVCGEISSASESVACQGSNGPQEKKPKFWDHQKEPIPTVITGEKGMKIKACIDTLFAPCFLSQRKKAEKALVELVSFYELKKGTVGDLVGCTWSSPINFFSASHRRLIIILFHCGASAPGLSLWAVHENEDGAVVFPFKGHMKGCGPWQVCNDFDGDGNTEIVIKHFVGDHDGAGTIAIWPAIYRWDGKNYVRADGQFPNYYVQYVVPKYQEILQKNKSWEKHTNNQIRRIYEKCKFVLEKAESIAKKTKP